MSPLQQMTLSSCIQLWDNKQDVIDKMIGDHYFVKGLIKHCILKQVILELGQPRDQKYHDKNIKIDDNKQHILLDLNWTKDDSDLIDK